MALSTTTKQLIAKLIKAAKEEAFAGAQPPEDRNDIRDNLDRARKRLEDHLMELL